MLDKHGLPMRGIKEAAGESHYKDRGLYIVIDYDMDTGMIYTHLYSGCNTRVQYGSPSVIHICTVNYRMTMQQIADRIKNRVDEVRYWAWPIDVGLIE